MFIRNLTRRLQLSKQQQQIWSSKELVGPPKNNFLSGFVIAPCLTPQHAQPFKVYG